MTIEEYLKLNTKAKNSDKKREFDSYYASLEGKIRHKIYRYRDSIIYHVVIPSEKKSEHNVTYDVVIEVEISAKHKGDAGLERLPFTAFSNCPGFVYGHVRKFVKEKMFIEWLKDKLDERTYQTSDDKDNTRSAVDSIEKSLYLALKYLHTTGRTQTSSYVTSGIKINSRTRVFNSVRWYKQISAQMPPKDSKSRVKDVGTEKNPFASKTLANNTNAKKTVKSTKTTVFTKSAISPKASKRTKRTKSVKRI